MASATAPTIQINSSEVIISVTIVTWNSSRTLKPCLDALFNQTLTNLEVIVVDNHSSDGTLGILQTYPALKILPQDSNLGFCKGHNLAIAQAHGKYILPLNPDVVMTETYIAYLVKAAESDPQVGMVSGRLLQAPPEAGSPTAGVIDSTGLFLKKTRQQFLRGHGQPDAGAYNQPEYIFGACGAAPLYRREMLEACKFDGQYFDEAFFAHKEDVDLAWRAQLLGWKCVYAPDAVAFHPRTFRPGHRQGISAEIRLHAVKNRYLLLLKNELLSTFLRQALPILFYDFKILAYLLLFEQSSLGGLARAIVLIPHSLRWRKFIMAHRKVDGKYMLAWMK
ncbi:MAG: glycosyltransferase family 2 protein [Chloroflexi bacterium]|nr:glycosyltransferase family 2 protein [Chloroflexota bacterium]